MEFLGDFEVSRFFSKLCSAVDSARIKLAGEKTVRLFGAD